MPTCKAQYNMRAAVFHGPGQALSIEDRQTPVARPGDIVLQVAYCGICGSDVHATDPGPFQIGTGTVLGHEFSGEVIFVVSLCMLYLVHNAMRLWKPKGSQPA